MNTRLLWLVAVLCIGVVGLVACGSSYSSKSNGLVIVPSTGSAVVQAFGFDLSSGKPSTINTSPMITGNPAAVVVDPAGAFAYVATSSGIAAFSIHSDGTLSAAGSAVTVTDLVPSQAPCMPTTLAPVAIVMDTAGKYLYVVTGTVGGNTAVIGGGVCTPSPVSGGRVATLSVSSGALTQTAISVPVTAPQGPNMVALAVTPLTFPALNKTSGASNSVCAGSASPAKEFLYAADAQNDLVWEFTVDSSGNLGTPTGMQSFPTGSVPAGIALDSCNRYVYVSNKQTPTISGYAICNDSLANVCPIVATQDGHLIPVSTTSITGAGSQPTALAVDPFARYLYVVDSGANKIFSYRLSQSTGTLTPLTPASLSTDSVPVSLAIRGDGQWMFVTNYGSGTVSEFSIVPASGAITAQAVITTDNNPYGVAVK